MTIQSEPQNCAKSPNVLKKYGFFIFSLLFLPVALYLLPHYGLGLDGPKNFTEGQINLNFYLGQRTFSDVEEFNLAYQIHGAFFFMVADLSKRVLSDALRWLDPVSARHAILPLLMVFFLNIFYPFLKSKIGALNSFLVSALFLTYPAFFGHLFFNVKDVSLLVMFSLSLLIFYEWAASGFKKTRFLYFFSLALGFALVSKLYALLVIGIAGLWFLSSTLLRLPFPSEAQLLPNQNKLQDFFSKNVLIHCLIGSLIIAIIFLLFFMPAYYAIPDRTHFWEFKSKLTETYFAPNRRLWNIYSWAQLFYVTPLLSLLMAFFGLLTLSFKRNRNALSLLMVIWFVVVMILPCTTALPVYDGIRLFLSFLIPFSYFGVLGLASFTGWTSQRLSIPKKWIFLPLCVLVLGAQVAGIIQMHPYEAQYFNVLAGGLKGAREKGIPASEDYWMTSLREAVDWVNANAPKDATLVTTNAYSFGMIDYYDIRKDMSFDFIRKTPLPKNFLVVEVASGSAWLNLTPSQKEEIKREISRLLKVHEIKRQGAVIATIYYVPEGQILTAARIQGKGASSLIKVPQVWGQA